jgi:hypothetical protein
MPLELRRKPDGTLKSKWWYGAYMINAHRYATNLGVKVKGTPPQQFAFWPPFMRSGWNPTLQKPTKPLFSAMEHRLPRRPFLEKRP